MKCRLSLIVALSMAPLAHLLGQPTIEVQPADAVADVGGEVSFHVVSIPAEPGASLTYQWQFNGELIPGETFDGLWLTDLAKSQRGNYAVTVTEATGSVTSRAASLSLFSRVTSGSPLVEEPTESLTGVWGDFDHDGDLDLFITRGYFSPDIAGKPNDLYRNDGNGSFAKLTGAEAGSIVVDSANSVDAAWADYDNDGDLDLYVANWGSSAGTASVASANYLYLNNGNGTFTRSATAGALVTDTKFSLGVGWCDYDRDGWVDLFVCDGRANVFAPGHYDVDSLYRNQPDGTFIRDDEAGLTAVQGASDTASWADYDDDGEPDLVVSHTTVQLQYRNDGGHFTRITSGALPAVRSWTILWTWGDFTGDGWLDLVTTTYVSGNLKLLLLENDRVGGFVQRSSTSLPGGGTSAGVATCADYDNDGDLDVFVARGESNVAVNSLMRNDGTGQFTALATASISQDVGSSTMGAWGDYDNNGFPDLLACNLDNQPDFLYRNEGNANHYVVFNLVGTRSNRSAIGAKVRVLATIRGESRWQMRDIQSSYGVSGLRAHFGLGDAGVVEKVRVEWPSGIVQELGEVAVDQFLTITEPPQLTSTEPGTVEILGGRGMTCEMFGSRNLVDWTSLGTVPLSDEGSALFQDDEANGLSYRFYRAEQ